MLVSTINCGYFAKIQFSVFSKKRYDIFDTTPRCLIHDVIFASHDLRDRFVLSRHFSFREQNLANVTGKTRFASKCASKRGKNGREKRREKDRTSVNSIRAQTLAALSLRHNYRAARGREIPIRKNN